ncbi:MAG: hypothetical protein E7371_05975 [Clostridiales bacterium]|nr:hypothetical protein [Clostridiales bacterium]
MFEQNQQTEPRAGYRVAALFAAIVALLAIAVIPFQALTAASQTPESISLLNLILKAVNGDYAEFGILPAFNLVGVSGIVYNVSIYAFAACLLTAAALGVVGLFSGKAPVARTSLCFLASGAAIYTVASLLVCSTSSISVDFLSLAIAIVGALVYTAISVSKAGKMAWLHFVQCILSLAFVLLVCAPLAMGEAFKAESLDTLPMIALYLGLVVALVNPIIAVARISRAGGIVADLVRFIVELVTALLITLGAADSNIMWSLLAVAVATLQILIIIVVLVKMNKKAVEDAAQEAGQAAVAGFHMEEYAEAYAYEGGPVSGVMMAEEVNPSFLPHEPHVNTAGYDFYNSKTFDPFIASLDANERNEFTELFILKFKGTMPELPDYEVGGDNKEFFRKIFIYLGQYRDRISQPLLMKMYQFSMKI